VRHDKACGIAGGAEPVSQLSGESAGAGNVDESRAGRLDLADQTRELAGVNGHQRRSDGHGLKLVLHRSGQLPCDRGVFADDLRAGKKERPASPTGCEAGRRLGHGRPDGADS
jgi:hypothetical protein